MNRGRLLVLEGVDGPQSLGFERHCRIQRDTLDRIAGRGLVPRDIPERFVSIAFEQHASVSCGRIRCQFALRPAVSA